MLTLHAPQPTKAQLIARAASGSSGVARKSQQALRDRVHAEMREELAKRQGGSHEA